MHARHTDLNIVMFKDLYSAIISPYIVIRQGSRSYLQRTGTVRFMGLFRRVQPYRAPSLIRGRSAGGRSSLRQKREEKDLHIHRR